jgi:hypothetical protein
MEDGLNSIIASMLRRTSRPAFIAPCLRPASPKTARSQFRGADLSREQERFSRKAVFNFVIGRHKPLGEVVHGWIDLFHRLDGCEPGHSHALLARTTPRKSQPI